MSLTLTRASGARNTFFICNLFDEDWATVFSALSPQQKSDLARRVCRGFDGFQTDGLLFIRPHKTFDFEWEFYNSDGSGAEMCGNAARCAALFFHKKVRQQKQIFFLTGAGEIQGEVLADNKVRVQMTRVSKPDWKMVLGHQGLFLNTGVPHFVLEALPDVSLARQYRQIGDFGVDGANITFVGDLSGDGLSAVTFERGVEDFTSACGTGAVAAAIFYQEKKGVRDPVFVTMPGGCLQIENAKIEGRPFLVGPAKLEFDILNFGVQ